jgi:alkanesulfonate monooxygenase SsuD/methylene tetrahydromethanopterin reductase-like flavin-dependent oxidoreductase (luciferase family)
MSGVPIPVGVSPTVIGVTAAWWLDAARTLERAGFAGAWAWDHFMSRGRRTDPTLECWTTLSAAAAVTSRLRVGSFVTNVMNRHPRQQRRMAATVHDLSGGRLELGIGIGGHPAEHAMYGMAYPEPPERAARVEEAVEVLRRLWRGGPTDFDGRYYQLDDAVAFPALAPPPRIVIGGEKPAGARLAARVGDAWTTNATDLARLRPIFLDTLAANGRQPADVPILVAVYPDRTKPLESQPLFADLADLAAGCRDAGASELIVGWLRPAEMPLLLDAAERAGLAG